MKDRLQSESAESLILRSLTPEEKARSVVYVADKQLPAGSRLAFPKTSLESAGNSIVAFVDLDPRANWEHPARYVLVDAETGATRSISATLPPFGSRPDIRWTLLYKAPSVPDAVVARLT